jgi:hypothetical protein
MKRIILNLICFAVVAGVVWFPSSLVQAACAPKAESMTVSPKTISRARSVVNISVKISGTSSCTPANTSNVKASVRILTTGYFAITWDLNTYIENEPGQASYTLEGTSNIFTAAPGVDAWKTIRLIPLLRVGAKEVTNQQAFVDLTNTSGTVTKTYAAPAPADQPIVISADPTTPNPAPTDPNAPAAPAFVWDGNINITDPTGDGQIGPVLTKIINWFLLVISLVAIIVMIYAGLLLVFNRGNEAQITKAKTTLIWAVIGLVVALGSFALVYLIQGVLS